MFDKLFIRNAINRSAENDVDRRRFLRSAGVAGIGVAGAGLLTTSTASAALGLHHDTAKPSDGAVLNFALNLEYLEAEFYLRAVRGYGLPASEIYGRGRPGGVRGGRKVKFQSKIVKAYAQEIAADELAHVKFLRGALGAAAVARPCIDIDAAFSAAATAAGLIKPGQKFDAYANENNFLLAAYVFEDVGVTAYKGAAPLITNKTYLEAAAGILAVEAYHAANIRTTLVARGLQTPSVAISNARDSLDGRSDLDQGTIFHGKTNIVPTDANGIAFSRSAGQVLNIVYLNPKSVTKGGFFPNGVNGAINTSAKNA
ncbi:ferritin-like domain-containing protein [Kribbella qitaiheensis]|uniref:Ferritin-like domain-containing protein n=1 Tax=Kribbella qitaiheensis TaxID=1544730 RepID=A0A7G6X559_9ACTN|nr:ferritin-like domain-containing protein [Kribbella qitaiheensis]QNE21374.1 ferritin-like domain-containing protein [Kribbella qitaiheensis]